MKHQLITLNPLERVTQSINGFPAIRELAENQEYNTPSENHAYVPILDRPDEAPNEGFMWQRVLTTEAWTWEQVALPDQPIQPVTRRQLHLALLSIPITPDNILAVLDGMPETTPEEITSKTGAKIEYEMATSYERDNALVGSIAGVFGLAPERVDELFELASTL